MLRTAKSSIHRISSSPLPVTLGIPSLHLCVPSISILAGFPHATSCLSHSFLLTALSQPILPSCFIEQQILQTCFLLSHIFPLYLWVSSASPKLPSSLSFLHISVHATFPHNRSLVVQIDPPFKIQLMMPHLLGHSGYVMGILSYCTNRDWNTVMSPLPMFI